MQSMSWIIEQQDVAQIETISSSVSDRSPDRHDSRRIADLAEKQGEGRQSAG